MSPADDDPHSFWYPQHGGVCILNDTDALSLERAFSVFENHLCKLVGLERNTQGIESSEEFALDRLTMRHMQLEYKEASTDTGTTQETRRHSIQACQYRDNLPSA